MSAQTNFRPQLHGFDFNNNWDPDDNYRAFIYSEIRNALPIAANVVVTNPGIAPALIAVMGAFIGIAEALVPGFDSFAIPVIVDQIVRAVNNKIENGLPDIYGACGGMAFVPLDYYYRQWAVPKGVYAKTIGNNSFSVPPVDIPNAAILRNYIFKRFEDTWSTGGVLDKMLQWFIILNTIPASTGGGGPAVQSRCKPEWDTLRGLLDQGKPQPIALLFDTWNIFANHQLVAYGYGGDPRGGPAFINIYDNRFPNEELLINFDFTKSEMFGTITDTAGKVRLHNDNGRSVPDPPLKGFFCADYTPATPPIGWGLSLGLTATTPVCQSVGEAFGLAATASNCFTFFEPAGQKTLISPVITDLFQSQILPVTYLTQGRDASAADPIAFAVQETFKYPALAFELAKAYLQVVKADGAVAVDQFNAPLAGFFTLPATNAQARSSLRLTVLDRLEIVPVNRSGSSCYFPFVEGQTIALHLAVEPFPGAHVKYAWTSSAGGLLGADSAICEILNLPSAGESFTVTVTETNLDTGCIAKGQLPIIPYSARQAGLNTGACKLAQYISHLMVPGLINPFGPDDRQREQFVLDNLNRIARTAHDIETLSRHLEELGKED